MLQRLDAMESELGALIESLRTGSNRLNADLQLLEGNLPEVRDAVAPRGRFEPEPGGGGVTDKAPAPPEVAGCGRRGAGAAGGRGGAAGRAPGGRRRPPSR